jgi:hypothetical protein
VVRGAILHEPPLLSMLERPEEVQQALRALVEQGIAEGGPPVAVERFWRFVAGDANWENLTPGLRQRMLGNADTFLNIEMGTFESYQPDDPQLATVVAPVQVLVSEHSAPFFAEVAQWLARRPRRRGVAHARNAHPLPRSPGRTGSSNQTVSDPCQRFRVPTRDERGRLRYQLPHNAHEPQPRCKNPRTTSMGASKRSHRNECITLAGGRACWFDRWLSYESGWCGGLGDASIFEQHQRGEAFAAALLRKLGAAVITRSCGSRAWQVRRGRRRGVRGQQSAARSASPCTSAASPWRQRRSAAELGKVPRSSSAARPSQTAWKCSVASSIV